MKSFKNKFPILISLYAASTWNQGATAIDHQIKNISHDEYITIDNLSGNFGEVLIEKGFTRTFQLKNNYSDSLKILSLNIVNDNYNSYNINDSQQELYCKNLISTRSHCNIPIFFKPKSIYNETAQLVIKYSINSIEKSYTFNLSGWGLESTESLKLLSKLGNNFIEIRLDENKKLDENFPDNIIPSSFANNHTEKYNYQNHSFQKPKTINLNRNNENDYSRASGYTFRVEERAPHVPYDDELCRKYNKKEDKLNCGIQDLGGFWPYGTMNVKPTVKKIEIMLNRYRSLTGNDFDIDKVSHEIINNINIPPLKNLVNNEIEKMNIDTLKDYLYQYLNDQLNLEKHVHGDYSYTGFVSTTASPKFLLNYHESVSRNWFYVMYVEGGIKYYGFNESEFAVPGGIDWNDVMGYYDRNNGKAYIRQGFESLDNEAFHKIKNVFSILNYEFNKPDYEHSPFSIYIQPL